MQGIGVSYVTTSEMSIHSLFYYTGPWNVVFSLKEEHQITKGNQLTTIPVLEKEWKVSFEFKANGYPATSQQLFHMTIGGERYRKCGQIWRSDACNLGTKEQRPSGSLSSKW